MDKGRVLLPWVISGLSMACLAIVVAVSANRPAPGISRAPSQASVPVVPQAPAAVPATAPAPNLASAPAPMPPPASPAVPPLAAAPDLAAASAPPAAAPGAQIWECRTNGQRTFSDKPCGDKPVLREVSALNIMNPTPILPPTRSYEPEPTYAPEYSNPEAARIRAGRISGDGGISGVRGICLQPSQKTRSRASALSSPSRSDAAENPVVHRHSRLCAAGP